METYDVRIWKMPLRSNRSDFEKDPHKGELARQFCFNNGWLGMGGNVAHYPAICKVLRIIRRHEKRSE